MIQQRMFYSKLGYQLWISLTFCYEPLPHPPPPPTLLFIAACCEIPVWQQLCMNMIHTNIVKGLVCCKPGNSVISQCCGRATQAANAMSWIRSHTGLAICGYHVCEDQTRGTYHVQCHFSLTLLAFLNKVLPIQV